MLDMTCHLSIEDQLSLRQATEDLEWLDLWAQIKRKKYLGPDMPKTERYKAYRKQSDLFWNAISLRFDDKIFEHENLLTLEFAPRYPKNTPYMKMSFSPALVSYDDIGFCLDGVIPGGLQRVFEEGQATRLDVALDILDVQLIQIILDHPGYTHRDPKIVSCKFNILYIGKDTGTRQFYSYDKLRQMQDKKYKIKPLSEYKFPQNGQVRVEVRLRPDPPLKFAELYNLPNQFQEMIIAGTPLSIVGKDEDFTIYRDACALKGMRAAINDFTIKQRKYVTGKIGKYIFPDFLDFDKSWATLPQVLHQTYPHYSPNIN